MLSAMSDPAPMAIGFEHVLVPLDGSDLALGAMPTARALAERLGASCLPFAVASDQQDAEALRQKITEAVSDGGVGEPVEVVVAGSPGEAIVRRLDELGTATVCMSSHGRGRAAGALVGSVARHVLTARRAPAVVVGPQADRPPLHGRPPRRPKGWPEPLSTGSVAACVDGSDDADMVVSVAGRWSAALRMDLSVLTVASDDLPIGGVRRNRFGPTDPEQYVAGLAERWQGSFPGATGVVVTDPIGVASGLRTHLLDAPIGLLVVATHGRSGWDRLRFGSAAADIVRTSTVPVLVAPISDDLPAAPEA
jgi:nucleotide-binding universal stress UspA family protein